MGTSDLQGGVAWDYNRPKVLQGRSFIVGFVERFFGPSVECKMIRGEMIWEIHAHVQGYFGETFFHKYVVPWQETTRRMLPKKILARDPS